MPSYSYKALDSKGEMQTGWLQADGQKAARSALRAKQWIPIEIEESKTSKNLNNGQGEGSRGGLFSKLAHALHMEALVNPAAFNHQRLMEWTRQMASLVEAGLSLERALASTLEEGLQAKEQAVVSNLRSEVNAGNTLAKAMQAYPREFPTVYQAVVAAGEHSGKLGMVLSNLADELESAQQLRNKVQGAMIYPAIVTLISIAIVFFLMTYVVPQVAQVFVGGKRPLPILTSIMLQLSGLIRSYGWLLLLIILGAWLLMQRWLRNTSNRQAFDSWMLERKLLGGFLRNYNAARFINTLSLLIRAGVPMLKALSVSAQTLNNQALCKDAMALVDLVREGSPLSSAVGSQKRWPNALATFARLGEQTGELPTLLARVGKQLSEQTQRRAMQIATLAEPVLIVVMGFVVLLIVLSVLLPIIQLNQYVK